MTAWRVLGVLFVVLSVGFLLLAFANMIHGSGTPELLTFGNTCGLLSIAAFLAARTDRPGR